MGKGGGSSQPTNTTVTNNNIPTYAQPFFTGLMQNAQSLAQQPFQPYPGQQLAGFTPQQQQAFGMAEQLPGTYAGDLSAAGTAFGNAGNMATQAGSFTPQQVTANYGQQTYSPSTFYTPQVQTGSFDQNAANAYMNPYVQDVVNTTSQNAIRSNDILNAGARNQMAQSGAFGGSRQGLVESENNRNLQFNLANIANQGYSNAFQNAQQQYTTDAARQLQASLANQQAGLQGQQLGEQSAQFGANFGNQSALAQAQMQQQAQLANEQAAQAAAGLGLQGGALQSQVGQGATWLGSTAQRAGLGDISSLLQAGAAQQGLGQQAADIGYSNYLNQLYYPEAQLAFESGIIHGLPVGTSSLQTQYQNPNQTGNLLGLGIGGLGLYNALGGIG